MSEAISLNFKEAKNIIKGIITENGKPRKERLTPFLWGQPGIGKSTLGRDIAKELGWKCFELDTPLLQPFDYAVAVPNFKKKVVELFRTGYLPQEGPAIVLIEDLPHAKPYQQIPVMQMVLDGRVGPLKFADDVKFIATGNNEEDYAFTEPISSPLLNRFMHFEIKADYESWVFNYGIPKGLDPRVVDFQIAFPQNHCHSPKEGLKTFPTPRSYEFLAHAIKGIDDSHTIRILAESAIGPGVATEFMGFIQYLRGFDPMNIIKKGQVPEMKVGERGKIYAYVLSVSRVLYENPALIDKYPANIGKFLEKLHHEFIYAFMYYLIGFNNGDEQDLSRIFKMLKHKETEKYLKEISKTLIEFAE